MTLLSYSEYEKDELILRPEDAPVDVLIILKGTVKLSLYPPSEVHKVTPIRMKTRNWRTNRRSTWSLTNNFSGLLKRQRFSETSPASTPLNNGGELLILTFRRRLYAYPTQDCEILRINFESAKSLFEVTKITRMSSRKCTLRGKKQRKSNFWQRPCRGSAIARPLSKTNFNLYSLLW